MNQDKFFDNRMRYLLFTQNTNEKMRFCELALPYIKKIKNNKSCIKVLDAGIGDGTIACNIIKTFHKFHADKMLALTGKEISFKDVKNTLEKLSDRFIEHPKLLITLTNVKYSEIHLVNNFSDIEHKSAKILKIELTGDSSYDFHNQLTGSAVDKFISRHWGISLDDFGKSSYDSPCIMKIYRRDQENNILSNYTSCRTANYYDLIIASQAYRSRSTTAQKIKLVISPLIKLLNTSGTLLVTHSIGGEIISELMKTFFDKIDPFPIKANDLINKLQDNLNNKEDVYFFSKPVTYEFNYSKSPLNSATQLFGREIDEKTDSVLYFAQLTDEEVRDVYKDKMLWLKLQECIRNHNDLNFLNEFFTIQKKIP